MKAPRLRVGAEIRVVAPASSFATLSDKNIRDATERLTSLGFKVSFGRHVHERDVLDSSSIMSRVKDIHEAFADKNVKAILSAIGGFNCNELLPYLDFSLIKANPKIFCGYSDITALCNAITCKTGMTTYVGPHFSSFQMDELQDYQTRSFLNVVSKDEAITICPSSFWSQDAWYLPNPKRQLFPNDWKVYNEAMTVSGLCFGGNLGSLQLLFGTEFLPSLKDAILFLENAEEDDFQVFTRALSSLMQVAKHPKALLIGRFPKESKMTESKLLTILNKYPLLKEIPVMYDMDFGHTQPLFTIPIGALVTVDTSEKKLIFK